MKREIFACCIGHFPIISYFSATASACALYIDHHQRPSASKSTIVSIVGLGCWISHVQYVCVTRFACFVLDRTVCAAPSGGQIFDMRYQGKVWREVCGCGRCKTSIYVWKVQEEICGCRRFIWVRLGNKNPCNDQSTNVLIQWVSFCLDAGEA